VRNAFAVELAKAELSKVNVNKFHGNITSFWSAESQCVLQHVLYTPPISVGICEKQFTKTGLSLSHRVTEKEGALKRIKSCVLHFLEGRLRFLVRQCRLVCSTRVWSSSKSWSLWGLCSRMVRPRLGRRWSEDATMLTYG